MLVPSLLLTAALIIIAMALVSYRYRTVWHPLLLPFGSLFVMVAAAPLAQEFILGARIHPVHQVQASLLTCLYVVSFTLPFLFDWEPIAPLIEKVIRPIAVSRNTRFKGGYQSLSLLFIALGCISYLMLISGSARGWDWIIHSRTAYQFGRSGVGHWYVLAQGFWLLAYLSWLWFCEIRNWRIFLSATIFLAGSFIFFGSKQGVIGILIAGGVFWNYFIRPMSFRTIFLIGLCALPLVVLSPWLQGNFNSIRQTLAYYDYFDNSSRYLQLQPKIGFQFGWAFFSSFWEYVPRGLYSGKPYIYGQLLINDRFWPGAAEQGHTPALLPWIPYHLDFGIAGIIAGGILSGVLQRGVYDYFLKTRSFEGLLLVMQFCFIPVLKHTPVLYYLAAVGGLSLLFHLANLTFSKLARQLQHPEEGIREAGQAPNHEPR